MGRISLATLVRGYESSGSIANESRGLTTEEIGSTAEAAITIERLKQDNLAQMEIHALEQDVALINDTGDTTDELITATEEITDLKSSLESYREAGGLTMRDATHIQRQLKSWSRRFGFQVMEMPAMESFRGSTTDRIALTTALEDSSDNFLVRIWKWIKEQWNKMVERIKSWFGKSDKSKKKADKKIEEAKEALKNANGELKLLPAKVDGSSTDATKDEASGDSVINAANAETTAVGKILSNPGKMVGPKGFEMVDDLTAFVNLIDKQYGVTVEWLKASSEAFKATETQYPKALEFVQAASDGEETVTVGKIKVKVNVKSSGLVGLAENVIKSIVGNGENLQVIDGVYATPEMIGGQYLISGFKSNGDSEEFSTGLKVDIVKPESSDVEVKPSFAKSSINRDNVEKSLNQLNTRIGNAEAMAKGITASIEEISKKYASMENDTQKELDTDAKKKAYEFFKVIATRHINVKMVNVYTSLLANAIEVAEFYRKLAAANK